MIAEVCLLDSNTDFDREYTYIVPPALLQAADVGVFVDVPFGKGDRLRTAVIVRICEEEAGCGDIPGTGSGDKRKKFVLKEIASICTKYRPVTENEVALCRRMQRRYLCSFGSAMTCMLPPKETAQGTERFLRLAVSDERAGELLQGTELRGIRQIEAIRILLAAENRTVSREEMIKECGISAPVLKSLARKGILAEETHPESGRKKPRENPEPPPAAYPPMVLNGEQNAAFLQIRSLLESGKPQELLLHGVTGSGKTEVYLHAIAETVKQGGTAIMLVPEISLTPQTVARFRGRFGEIVAVFHSRLTDTQRRAEYDRVKRGEARIAVGARSAVFLPLENLKLIILDEEQEHSYKAFEDAPPYHAGEIARMRAELTGATVIYGSATPRTVTYYRARQGEIAYARLTRRAAAGALPRVVIADMKEELRNGNYGPFSGTLYAAMKKNCEAGLQTVLFVPRRGYAGRLTCAECGRTMTCGKCRIAMTYHKSAGRLICHYCGNTVPAPKTCPACGSVRFLERSVGTELLEDELRKLFPGKEVVRMDSDTTAGKDGHRRLLSRFGENACPFLVGTQMIAKGLDFPDVTLVGVINADGMLNIPEYNAGERTFQLLTQVFGRAGRDGKESLGILQTVNGREPVYQYAIRQDYDGFYENEIRFRETMGYPPFRVLCTVTVSGRDDRETYRLVTELRTKVFSYTETESPETGGRDAGTEVLFAARAPVPKIGERYRWTFLVKTADLDTMLHVMGHFVARILPELSSADKKHFRVGFDIDL